MRRGGPRRPGNGSAASAGADRDEQTDAAERYEDLDDVVIDDLEDDEDDEDPADDEDRADSEDPAAGQDTAEPGRAAGA